MDEVKIFDKIVVDEPKNVEIAIYNITGKKVEFELVRKFILNEESTMFYLDRKLNSSTDPSVHKDYLWLDTGFRDEKDCPIMICLQYRFDGYVGHYTGTVKELARRVKTFNRKNAKDIDKNYNRFLEKYKRRIVDRRNSFIKDTAAYAIDVVNRNSFENQETDFALAIRCAGVKVETSVLETDEIVVEEAKEDEELTAAETEITIGLLVDQMEHMQTYIDSLLRKIETQEKTSTEEIAILKAQNQEYKNAILNIRLFNSENEPESEISDHDTTNGHWLLGRNNKILVLGNTDIKVAEMKAIAKNYFGFEKADFEFITDYEKIKTAGNRIHCSSRYAAVIFGNCPHKVSGMGNYKSIIDEFKKREGCPISIDARTEAGGLKITKQSFRNALNRVYLELRNLKAA